MDQQLLNALNNLSNSLEMIADALQKKGESKTATTNALQSGDFSKQLIEINTSLKSIKKDTQEILSKQNTILKLQESKKKDNIIGESGEDPKKESQIKKGATMILLIAAAVLAIGLAFKIVGEVDFLSVVALGLAIVLIGNAFVKIAESKMTLDDAIVAGKVMVVMSIAIMLSSWILSLVEPIGFTKLLNAILIAGMFAVLSKYLENIFIATILFKKLNVSTTQLVKVLVGIALAITASSWVLSFIQPMSFAQAMTGILIAAMFAVVAFNMHKIGLAVAIFQDLNINTFELVKVLVGIALAITASSWVLSFIKPMSFTQALTGILIAAMFAVVAFNMDKIALGVVAFKKTGVKATDLLLVLVGIAAAITVSSWILSFVQPIGFWQFLTVLGIALVFALMSYFMEDLAIGVAIIEKIIGQGKVYLIPLVLVAIAMAIALSSAILAGTVDLPFLLILKILLLGATLAIVTLMMTPAVILLGRMPIEDLITGGIAIVALAAVIAISSNILTLGQYDIYPDWKWALGVGLSMLAFGIAAVELGSIILSGIGAAALVAGAVGILLVAGTIVATSFILGKGTYENYPTLSWSMGTGLSLTAFGLAMAGLGAVILGSFGLGLAALGAGSVAVLMIADTIVKVSFVLKKGSYTGGPTKAWAEGISLALGAFAPVYKMLSTGGIMKALFGSGPTPEQFSDGIITVSKGIVDAANYFSNTKVAFKGGPSKEWSEGVGTAIAAFSPVYAALMDNGFFGSNVSPDDMKSGILTISDGIIAAADKFAENKATFDVANVPDSEWGTRVSSAIQAFGGVFDYMSKNSGWFKDGDEAAGEMANGIVLVANAIVRVAKRLASVGAAVWKAGPGANWSKQLNNNINGFIDLNRSVESVTYASLLKTNIIAYAIIRTAKTLWSGRQYFNNMIPEGYMDNLQTNIMKYLNLTNSIVAQGKGGAINALKNLTGMDPVSQTAKGMLKIAAAYDKLAQSLEKFGNSLQMIDGTKVNLIRRLTGNLAVLAAMDSDALDRMMQTLEERASVFSKFVEVEKARTNRPTVGETKGKATAGTSGAKGPTKMNTNEQLNKIIEILSRIDTSTSTIDDYITSITDGNIKPTELSSSGNTKSSGGGFFSGWFN
jgi:hypothetical protein